MNKNHIINIEKILENEKIINTKLLSSSFDINCVKLLTDNHKTYIVKYYNKNKKNFNSIFSENNNLVYLNNLGFTFFPKVYSDDKKYLLMSFINSNNLKPKKTNEDLMNAIISLHSISGNKYGFDFDTQIGGLKQINTKNDNWVDFYRKYRLGYIFEIINMKEPMDENINKKIEILLKNLSNYIPNKPRASLLHGDLWEGNILFKNEKFVSFLDPGSFFGHNELEVAYLRWFNPDFIDNFFLEKYNDYIDLDKNYIDYEPIYQLYYSLLNVYLWDRNYINDVSKLLEKIKI